MRSSRESRLARAAIERIAALGHVPTPQNFEFWYAYASGHDKELNAAVDARVADGSLTPTVVRALFDDFLSPDRFLKRIHTVSESLCDEAGQFGVIVEETASTANGYHEDLVGASRRLSSPGGRQSIEEIAAELARSTRDAIETSERLHAQLKASETQVRRLLETVELLYAESMTDALTAVLNRNGFEWSFARMAATAEAGNQPVCLLLVDVDRFETFNDQYGHQAGDDVLRLVARAIRQNVRAGDVVARLGGDEFAVILPQTSLAQASAVAETVRLAVSGKQLVRRSTREKLAHLSISIGVADFSGSPAPEDVVQRANAALYAAKRGGRDRVVAWAPEQQVRSEC